MAGKSALTYLMFVLTATSAYAGWIRGYKIGAMSWGYSVWQTTDGGYIITGWTALSDTAYGDLSLIKTDSLGDTVWTKIYGSGSDDVGTCVQQTKDGGYIILGFANVEGDMWPAGDIWLLKTDALGDTMWTRIYRGYNFPHGGWVEQTSDGGYIFTSNWDMAYLLLLKTDKDGNTEWSKNYQWGSGQIETGYCVRQTWDGGYIVATNLGLFKTDENGDSIWLKSVPSGCVDQTSDYGYIQATSHNEDIWIVKTDWKGDTIWTKTYGGTAEEYSYDVHQTTDGGYIIFGNSDSFGGGWILKTDTYGDTSWTRIYKGCNINSGQQTSDCGYVITGYTTLFAEDIWPDILLIKTDSLGYAGVEEPVTHPVTRRDWEVVNPVGQTITLRYENHPQGFSAIVYDATGRKVEELSSASQSGTITWPVTPGVGFQSGVYFVREESAHPTTIQKVILLH